MARGLLRLVEVAFYVAASLLMLGLVAITFTDVIGRRFGAPLPAAFELTQIAVGVMFYVALPFVTLRREHVTVELLPIPESGLLGRAIGLLVDLLSAGVVAFAARQLWIQSETLAMFNSTTMFLRVPVAPIVQVMAALAALTAVFCLVLAVGRLLPGASGGGPAPRDARQ